MADAAEKSKKAEEKPRLETNWPKVLLQLHIHAFFLYGAYFLFRAQLVTVIFSFALTAIGLLGATAGSHRLWAHQSYKAHTILKIFLMICQTLCGNGTIYDWVLDHRLHHKYHGTNDDPYNYKRGFFYSHMGARMTNANANRAELESQIDMSDMEADGVVMFQRKFYWVLMPIICLLFPINTPVEYWGEEMIYSIMTVVFFRIPLTLHGIWLINSGRSVWGLEPNDRFFSDSNLVFLIKKSYWHEYHYTVPWDYLTDEFGSYNSGWITGCIKIWVIMGLVSEPKTIGSKGVTLALEQAVETGAPIGDCLEEMRDDMLLYKYEDSALL